jgi:hypothetical protein
MASATRSSQRQKPVLIVYRCQCSQSAVIGKLSSRHDRTIQIARPFSELKATLTVALPS